MRTRVRPKTEKKQDQREILKSRDIRQVHNKRRVEVDCQNRDSLKEDGVCMSCTLGQASDHPSSFLCPLLSVFTLSSFQRTVATNLAKKDQDSRVVLAWRARRSDDAARDGRRQDGSGRVWTERSFRRWNADKGVKTNRELCTACLSGAQGRKRQRLAPQRCEMSGAE